MTKTMTQTEALAKMAELLAAGAVMDVAADAPVDLVKALDAILIQGGYGSSDPLEYDSPDELEMLLNDAIFDQADRQELV